MATPSDRLSPYYHILGVSSDATLEQLDQRYLELICIWAVPNHPGDDEFAQLQVRTIDNAYVQVLRHFMATHKDDSTKISLTHRQVEHGIDRMAVPLSQASAREDLWIHKHIPPRPAPPSDPEKVLPPGFSIIKIKGDVLDAPDRAVIVHAVNCQGVWGFGIASQLKLQFPGAFQIYREHCKEADKPVDLLGTCLLIDPEEEEDARNDKLAKSSSSERPPKDEKAESRDWEDYRPRLWIACLFTSLGYGKKNMRLNNPGRDTVRKILYNTAVALENLRTQLEEFTPSNFDEETAWDTDDDKPGEIRACKFNSGAFGVPWEETEALIEQEFKDFERPWVIVDNKT